MGSPMRALEIALVLKLADQLRDETPVNDLEVCGAVQRTANLTSKEVIDVPISTYAGSVSLRFVFERGRYKLRGY
jgi:hypothetical protein